MPQQPKEESEKINAYRAKASTYRRIAQIAEQDLQDLRISTIARDAARAYDEAQYAIIASRTRDLALQFGHAAIAECIIVGVAPSTDRHDLPNELVVAIENWLAVLSLRPERYDES